MRPSTFIQSALTLTVLLVMPHRAVSQCVPTGAAMPSTISNNSTTGSLGWSNLSNGLSSNNSYISCGSLLGVLASAQTNYIQSSGYGFAIPTTATVCGIEVRVERKADGLLVGSSITDKNVFLMRSGTWTGTNHATGAGWTAADAVAVYGSNSDLWGSTWTPADINATNFGVLFSAQLNAGLASLFLTANIDAISVTVYYTASTLPVNVVSFTGGIESQTIKLEWRTAGEPTPTRFEVEKMNDDYSWRTIGNVDSKSHTGSTETYTSYDSDPNALNYYRLRQYYRLGQSEISETISVEYNVATGKQAVLYPLPVSDALYVRNVADVRQMLLSDLNGRNYAVYPEATQQGYRINTSTLPAGIYTLRILTPTQVFIDRLVKQ